MRFLVYAFRIIIFALVVMAVIVIFKKLLPLAEDFFDDGISLIEGMLGGLVSRIKGA